MKIKILLLTIFIMFSCSLIYAQEDNVKSISVRFGVSNLLGEIGNDQQFSKLEELFKMDGYTYGIAYHFNLGSSKL